MTGTNQPGLYAIIDVIAQAIVHNVMTISRHEAPMVRMFTDLLGGQGPIAEHPADYQLVRVGYIDENHELTGCTPFQVVLTGAQWARLHQPDSRIDPTTGLISGPPKCEPEGDASPPLPQRIR